MENLGAEVEHLLGFLSPKAVVGNTTVGVTTYMVFMTIAVTLLLLLLFYARRRAALVPEGRLYNLVEAGVEFVRNGVAGEIIGADGAKYFPFIGTVFFFILINNFLGLVPGFKPGTGTMGITVPIALVVFFYFNIVGMKKQGFLKYWTGLVPHGVPWWIAWLVWILEVISMFMRPFTLSVRLFANMYAGHIVLGIFAILTSIGIEQAIEGIQHASGAGIALGSISTIAWLALLTGLYLLETLVAFIQAYVFTLLTTVYIGAAISEH